MNNAIQIAGDPLLNADNCVLAVIDYQPLQVSSVASMKRRELVENITSVVRAAKLYKVPIVLSTVNVESGRNRPVIRQIADELPGLTAIDRTTLNAWEHRPFRDAIAATRRKKLVIAAIWTEVCLTFPVLSALRDGYEVFPMVDAVGGTSLEAHRAALARMQRAGAQPVSWVQWICELQRDWARTATVPEFSKILFTVEGA